MREDSSGDRRNRLLLGGIAVLAIAVLGWSVWSSLSGGSGGGGGPKPAALCSACGYYAEGSALKLEGGRGARAPLFGPGYKCPRCSKETLYVNPFTCAKCKTHFLLSQSPTGEALAQCPKCGQKID